MKTLWDSFRDITAAVEENEYKKDETFILFMDRKQFTK